MLLNSPQLQSEPSSKQSKKLSHPPLEEDTTVNECQTVHLDQEQKAMEVFLNANNEFPDEFYCPITLDVMKHPVIANDGRTYEKSAIEEWLKNHANSPITNQKITSLTTNYALKNIIEDKLSDYYGTNSSDNTHKSKPNKPAAKNTSFFVAKEDRRRFFAREVVNFINDIKDYLRLHASNITLEKNIEFKIVQKALISLSNSSEVESSLNNDTQISGSIKEKLISYINLCIAQRPNLHYAKHDEEYCDMITDLLGENNINEIKEKGGMAIEEQNKTTGFCSWFRFTS